MLSILLLVCLSCLAGCGPKKTLTLSGECGKAARWTLNDSGHLTILGEGETYDIAQSEDLPWGAYASVIEEVVVEDGITRIGDHLFDNLPKLASVNIAGSVLSIGNAAFSSCDELTSVTLNEGVTTIEPNAFGYCASLTQIEFPESLRTIEDNAFSYCIALQDITSGGGVEYIGKDAFINTKWIASLEKGINYFDHVLLKYTGSVSEGYHLTVKEGTTAIAPCAFSGFEDLVDVEFPNSLNRIGAEAFSNTKLISVQLDAALEQIDADVFKDCYDLQYVYFRGIPKKIGMFTNMSNVIIVGIVDTIVSDWAEEHNYDFLSFEEFDETTVAELRVTNSLPEYTGADLDDGVYTILLNCVLRENNITLVGYMTEPVWFTASDYNEGHHYVIDGTEYKQIRMSQSVVFCPPASEPYLNGLYSLLPFADIPTTSNPSLIYVNNACDYICNKVGKITIDCAKDAMLYPRTIYYDHEYYGNALYDEIDTSLLELAEGYEPQKISDMEEEYFHGYGLYIWGLENKDLVQVQIIVKNGAVKAVIIPNA